MLAGTGPSQSHCHAGISQSSWRTGRVPVEGWTRSPA